MREWAETIRAAQLWASEAIVEGGSLKARLVHARGRAGAAGS
jgi:hypothetical protein